MYVGILLGRPGHYKTREPHTAHWLTLTGPGKVTWKLQNKNILVMLFHAWPKATFILKLILSLIHKVEKISIMHTLLSLLAWPSMIYSVYHVASRRK